MTQQIQISTQADGLSQYLFGKVQRQALDLEEGVLGSLMLESVCVPLVIGFLRAEHFYSEAHQVVFTACETLYKNNVGIDLLTVTEHLRGTGNLEKIGGAYAVTELTNKVTSAANVEYYCRIIKQCYIARQVGQIGGDMLRDSYDDTVDALELLDRTDKRISDLIYERSIHADKNLLDLAHLTLDRIEHSVNVEEGILGIPTWIKALDTRTLGFGRSELICIGGRPGMGKTSVALQMALNQAMNGIPVAVFSLEAPSWQIIIKLLASKLGIDSNELRKANKAQVASLRKMLTEEIGKLPIFIFDNARQTYSDICYTIRRLYGRAGLQAAYVDYLQLCGLNKQDYRESRDRQIGIISREFKTTAMELDMPIIALSQLNRSVEQKAGRIPDLSDLRESGNIEQDCDLVLLLYRPHHYQITDKETGYDFKNDLYIIGAKNRNGAPFYNECRVKFVPEYCKTFDANDVVTLAMPS